MSQIDQKISILDLYVKEINKKISSLHQELLHLPTTISITSPLIHQKESGLKSLKAQLHSIQNQPKAQSQLPFDIFTPYPIYTYTLYGPNTTTLISPRPKTFWIVLLFANQCCRETPSYRKRNSQSFRWIERL
ncbi:unnamed protein product [Thlaspi arvense]|uniref:Uncharacterized protein n=1 Tax=Thlaspi arvense TaxID=13288 RepID=A0AAU9SSN9_THLAR|nr:unnamed protein product [Thlaspi arvense]